MRTTITVTETITEEETIHVSRGKIPPVQKKVTQKPMGQKLGSQIPVAQKVTHQRDVSTPQKIIISSVPKRDEKMAEASTPWLKLRFQQMKNTIKAIAWKLVLNLIILGMIFVGLSSWFGMIPTALLFLGVFTATKTALPQKAIIFVKSTRVYPKLVRFSTYSFSKGLQFSTTLAGYFANLIRQIMVVGKSLSKSIVKRIGSTAVNTLSTRNFLRLASVFPIGDWLLYEEPYYISHNTALLEAVEKEDHATIDKIIKVTSKDTFYQLLLVKDFLGLTALDLATLRSQINVVEKLLRVVEPERLLTLLKSLVYNKLSYVFHLPSKGNAEEFIELVMELLPKKDHVEFMEQKNERGETPILMLARMHKPKAAFEAFLKYYPKERLVNYLKIINNEGMTAFIYLISVNNPEALEYVMSLIAESERSEYLHFHNQGEKGMLVVHAYQKKIGRNKEYLTAYGIVLPERFSGVTKANISKIYDEWEHNEQFRKRYNSYPFEILKVEDTQPDEKIVKKNYQRLMRENHPDKNPSENAHQITQDITCAYEFYTKPETRQNLK